jgi:hypothetical protein
MARGSRQDAGIPRAARWRVGGSRGVAAPYPKARRRGGAGAPRPCRRRPPATEAGPAVGAASRRRVLGTSLGSKLLGAFRILSP